MTTRTIRVGFLLAAFFGASAATRADDGTKSTTPPSTSPAAPAYITVGDIVGTVQKVDANSITVRVTWYTQTPAKGAKNQYGHWHNGTSGRSPQQMHQHMMQMQQQLARRATSVKSKENHKDYTMDFASDAQARIKHYPPKAAGADGKPGVYTAQEYHDMKGNPLIPGWKADLSELKTGQLVEAHIVRTPGSTKTADTKDDMIVRWTLIINDPPAHAQPTTTASNKKK